MIIKKQWLEMNAVYLVEYLSSFEHSNKILTQLLLSLAFDIPLIFEFDEFWSNAFSRLQLYHTSYLS